MTAAVLEPEVLKGNWSRCPWCGDPYRIESPEHGCPGGPRSVEATSTKEKRVVRNSARGTIRMDMSCPERREKHD